MTPDLLEHLTLANSRYGNMLTYTNDTVIGDSIRIYGEYQQAEIDFLLPYVADQVVYDIGANIGYHARAFASQAKTVYSFEAHPSHFQVLEHNTKDLENSIIKNVAISDKKNKIKITDIDITTSSNFGETKVTDAGLVVSCETVDSMKLPAPNLIKIDVEGHELQVLQGSIETIKKHLPIIYFEAQDTSQLKDIYPLLTDLGYLLDWCVVRNYLPNNWRKNPINIFGNTAIFSIFAHQPSLGLTQWLPVQGPGDNWQRFTNDA